MESEGETQKYQSLGALRDRRSYLTHVAEGEAGLERGNDVPKVSEQDSSRTRLEPWSLESLANRMVDPWVLCGATFLSTQIS